MYPEWVRKLPRVNSPFEGAVGWLLTGGDGQVVFWEFSDETAVPPHKHGPQLGFVLSGRTVMTVEGRTAEWGSGDVFEIGAQELHSAVVDAGTHIVEIFQEADRHKARPTG